MEHLTAETQKSQGAHYTPPELAQFVAQQIVAAWRTKQDDKSTLTILDPAVGGGELIEAIYSELPNDLLSRARMV